MEGVDRPIKALSMHVQKPLRITKGNNFIKLAPSPYFSTISICSVDMNMYARLDEIPYHIWIYISLFIGCLVETRNYSILSLAFIVSSFRVTEENLVFETVQSDPYSSFECFLCS